VIAVYVRLVSRGKLLHKGKRFELRSIEIPGRNGPLDKEIIVHPPSVVIIGVPSPGSVVLIDNDRPSIEERLLEAPAGAVDPGEEPIAAAARELAEETGYSAATLTPLGAFYLAPGYSTELMYAFRADGLSGGPEHQSLQPDERIKVRVLTMDEAWAAVKSHAIRDAKTIAALTLFERNSVED
jgi:ADP-ribose pyrophosphatase